MSDPTDRSDAGTPGDAPQLVVVDPTSGAVQPASTEGDEGEDTGGSVDQPAKVMRIGSMIKQLLDEVRQVSLDEAGRTRLAEIYATSVNELAEGLSEDLREELARFTPAFREGEAPSEGELRVAHAQLVGWLEGLFHGIQATLMAQQMAARAQLEEMRRRSLTAGGAGDGEGRPGTYL